MCAIDSSKTECQSGLFQRISDWILFQQEESLWYSFSRDSDWLSTITDTICAGFGSESNQCELLNALYIATSNGLESVSAKVEQELTQRAYYGRFTEFSDSFLANGWYT